MNEAQWRAALTQGHEVIVKMEHWRSGRLLDPNFRVDKSGGVVVDGGAATRRQLSCVPLLGKGALMPTTLGVSELRPYRGIRVRGQEKYWPLGVFRVSTDDLTQTRKGTDAKISLYDISRTLTVNRLYQPVSTPAGMPVEEVIEKLFSQVLPGVTYSWPETSAGPAPALLFEEGEKPWESAQKLYAQYGYDLYPDALGRVTGAAPSAYDIAGARRVDNSTLLKVTNHREDNPGYNGIKVVGEPDNAPSYVAYCWDDDPNSPTYWRGDYGKRIRFYKSKFLTTQDQVFLAAQRMYPSTVGVTQQAKFSTLVDPTLEAGHIYAMQAPGVGLAGNFAAQSFEIPFDIDADMDVTTDKVRNGRTANELPEAA